MRLMRKAHFLTLTALLICSTAFSQDATTEPAQTSQPTALDGTDSAAAKAAEGKDVVVTGKIVKAGWSSSGKVMRAAFSNDDDALQLIVFSRNKDALDKAFGGDIVTAIGGAHVKLTGKVVDYRGHPEIVLNKPQQLTIVSPASTKP